MRFRSLLRPRHGSARYCSTTWSGSLTPHCRQAATMRWRLSACMCVSDLVWCQDEQTVRISHFTEMRVLQTVVLFFLLPGCLAIWDLQATPINPNRTDLLQLVCGCTRSPHLYTHALHTYRINLSPFTKDFRVWGVLNETYWIFLMSCPSRGMACSGWTDSIQRHGLGLIHWGSLTWCDRTSVGKNLWTNFHEQH